MALADLLDDLPRTTPAERFRQALSLYDEGVELQTMNFRRRHPDYTDEQIAQLLRAWLLRENEH